ncbi:MAG: DUF3556 domain-containing protein [Microthrixaceae bacterium]
MGLIKPDEPDFDVDEWRAMPAAERLRMMCVTWSTQGFGAPDVVYVFYVMKILVYVGVFFVCAALTPSLGGPLSFGEWWANPIAFQKAVLWTMMFEVMGLGCGAGPLTGHYKPLFPAVRHWLQPGTTRLRPFTWVPFTEGHRRTWVDVALYAGLLALVVRALVAAQIELWQLIPIVAVLCVLGLRDKTIFLAARSEHYLLMVVVFCFASDLFAGAKVVQLMVWIGAATSKLTRHFPNVMAIMQSNNPIQRSTRFRKALYRNYPDDLRGSRLAATLAHTATAVEFLFPLTLAFTVSGPLHGTALAVMVIFHLGIILSVPMGVPLEWNIMCIYTGLVLFGAHGDVRFWSIDSPLLVAILVAVMLLGPVLGNLRPDKISFLPSMRYYAGNWAASVWLFKPGKLEQLDRSFTKAAPLHSDQLEGQIEPGTYDLSMARGSAMRAMHLHGRALAVLEPELYRDLAAADPDIAERGTDAFDKFDGEMIAGLVLGWNFGDGHLHHEQLLAAVQAECGFEPGDLRCLFLESQPLHRQRMHWRVADAAAGPMNDGYIRVADLLDLQPWGARTG